MRIRVKFSKTGAMKFIGHLDVMRYFQKALRRADLPYALSGGFSPHMLMSFAAPLGVGKTSTGEYFDLDLREPMDPADIRTRLQAQMAEGFSVLSVVEIPENKASKGMSLVAAAEYSVIFPDPAPGETLPAAGGLTDDTYDGAALLTPAQAGFTPECVRGFLEQEQIMVLRKTKRKEEVTDIRPWILALTADERAVHMRLSAGSVQNLKPELVMETLCDFAGVQIPSWAMRINRDEILSAVQEQGGLCYRPLDALGAGDV